METQDEEEQVLQEALEKIDHGDFGDTAIEKPREGVAECYTIDNQQDAGDLPEPEFRDESFVDHVDRPQGQAEGSRSPPLNIVRKLSCPEKVAELFPSDSDSSWSALSSSRPSSMHSISGCSDHLNMSGIGWSQDNPPSLESLDLAIEQGKKNSSKIENIQKGTSRRAIRMKDFISEFRKMMTGLQVRVNQLEQKVGKEEECSPRVYTQKHLPQRVNSCLSWVVPYSDLKQQSAQSIISPELKLPWLQGLKATLHLLGIGKGQGSHLSIGFSWPKKRDNPKVDESFLVIVTVQIINQEDASESIEKMLYLDTCQEDGGSSTNSSNLNTSIPKLIPISTVEDTPLGYLFDGRLLINISIEDPGVDRLTTIL